MKTKLQRIIPEANQRLAGQTSSSDSNMCQQEPHTTSQTVGPDMPRLPTFKLLVVSTCNVHILLEKKKNEINDNGETLVNLCQECKLCLSQKRFPQPRNNLWIWMRQRASTHQLEHILINNKWVNSCTIVGLTTSWNWTQTIISLAYCSPPASVPPKENHAGGQSLIGKKLKDVNTKHDMKFRLSCQVSSRDHGEVQPV